MPDKDDASSPIGRSWRSTFQTEDKSVAEKITTECGGTFEWLEGKEGNLFKQTSCKLPGIITDGNTGEKCFFNQMVAVYFGWNDSRNVSKQALTFGDGELLPHEPMNYLEKCSNELSVAFKWEKNDIILINNMSVQHSRNSFEPPRKIYAYLCQ